MRFRFCWDCDCPDWVLAEIFTLSKIKPSLLKEFADLVARSIVEEHLKFDSAVHLLSDCEFDEPTVQALIAAIRWILSNAAGASIDETVLNSELQQLGLPKEQSEAVRDTFHDYKDEVKAFLKEHTLKASRNVKWNYDIKGVSVGKEKDPLLQLKLEGKILDQRKGYHIESHEQCMIPNQDETLSIYMTEDQVRALIYELEDAYKYMKEIKPEN